MSHTNCHCKKKHTPFRVDHVGSFLRPKALVEAREQFAIGKLSQAELTKVEDDAIRHLVTKQKEAGLKGITDGEFRRAYWHLDFFWGLNGVAHTQAAVGYQFHGETTKADAASLTGRISGENHPFVEHYRFLHELAGEESVARQTIPSPAQFYFELVRDADHTAKTFSFYETKEELFADIIAAYRQVIQDLYDAGCRNLQLDDCTWGVLVDARVMDLIAGHTGRPTDEIVTEFAEEFLTLNNGVLVDLPEDLVVNTHVCRGNYHSTWASSGGYGVVADTLFARENVDAYYLEYDTDRAGDFTPLAKVSPDKKVVLGLITSKTGELEDKATVIARIKEASQYVPLENIYLSPQCGFASTEEGNILTEEAQWAKIQLIQEIVQEVWGE